MITKMIFKNIGSFKETQVIEFNNEDNIYAIIGKNSAGKTNVLRVIELLRTSIEGNLFNLCMSNDVSNKFSNDDISIAIEFYFHNQKYFYNFNFDTKNYIYNLEELLFVDGNIKTIFKYTEKSLVSDVLSKEEINSFMQFNIAKDGVFAYIEKINGDSYLDLLSQIKVSASMSVINFSAIEHLANDSNLLKLLIDEIKKIDVSIDDIQIKNNKSLKQGLKENLEQNKQNPNDILKNIPDYELKTIHDGVEFSLNEESTGTNRYIDLLVGVIVLSKNESVIPLYIDELSVHLHDDLFEQFLNYMTKEIKQQFLFTTHNQKILDEKLIQKEGILIVDKEGNDSKVTCMAQYKNLRSDNRHNWKKIYNKNMIGGKPNVL